MMSAHAAKRSLYASHRQPESQTARRRRRKNGRKHVCRAAGALDRPDVCGRAAATDVLSMQTKFARKIPERGEDYCPVVKSR